MKKLDKQTLKQRDELQMKLIACHEDLDAAIAAFNDIVEVEWDKVEQAMSDYNTAIADANSWRTDIAGEIQTYMDDRSDKWREGDKGQAYQSWLEEFENGEFEEASLEKPEPLSLDVEDVSELMSNLPEEVSE